MTDDIICNDINAHSADHIRNLMLYQRVRMIWTSGKENNQLLLFISFFNYLPVIGDKLFFKSVLCFQCMVECFLYYLLLYTQCAQVVTALLIQ